MPGHLVVVCGGASVHGRATKVRQYLAKHPAVTAVTLPEYASKRDPDELVWRHAEDSRVANVAPAEHADLRARVREELRALKTRPEVLRPFVKHAALPALASIRWN